MHRQCSLGFFNPVLCLASSFLFLRCAVTSYAHTAFLNPAKVYVLSKTTAVRSTHLHSLFLLLCPSENKMGAWICPFLSGPWGTWSHGLWCWNLKTCDFPVTWPQMLLTTSIVQQRTICFKPGRKTGHSEIVCLGSVRCLFKGFAGQL